jgi:hypothetical protein
VATTPQGDDADVRRTVMNALVRAVARQRIAGSGRLLAGPKRKPKKLTAVFSLATAPKALRP